MSGRRRARQVLHLVGAMAFVVGVVAVLPLVTPFQPMSARGGEGPSWRVGPAAAPASRGVERQTFPAVTHPDKYDYQQPPPVQVPDAASGEYAVVPGRDAAPRRVGRVLRYIVEVERGLPFEAREFAAAVQRILNDPRGWGRGGDLAFERVHGGRVAFRVGLASPELTDEICWPLYTHGELSCHASEGVVINARRWGLGAQTWGDDIGGYREYVVSHEVGHALGYGHRSCPSPGAPAPVMVQQTKSLEGCRANAWPYP
ncbi:MAG: DUF3152 domain-containing protein [Carbonactinosporaceae bacterium]